MSKLVLQGDMEVTFAGVVDIGTQSALRLYMLICSPFFNSLLRCDAGHPFPSLLQPHLWLPWGAGSAQHHDNQHPPFFFLIAPPLTISKIKIPKHDQHLNNKQQVFNEDWFAVPYVMVTCQVQLNYSLLPMFTGNIIQSSIHSCNMIKTDLIRKTELSTKLTGMPTIAFGVS